ncbi:Golgi to plasma membrane protein transport [Tritrichomonas musculus]|uniref:Golgi to plasma membrane protein transport n=1 Tax=Tritrichomonas musculus TaxID=1915356 RepID=A0ABR2L398_9EUKA
MFGLVSGIIHEIVDKTISKSSLLFLGIDGAGKTTLIEKIMQIVIPNRKPKTIRQTLGLNTDMINDGKISLRVWDLGGKPDFRNIWNNYLPDATAVVYVVNGKQDTRIHETRKLFDDITCRFTKPMAIVFLNSDRSILDIFPAADRAKVYFIDIENKDNLMLLYEWMKSTAQK